MFVLKLYLNPHDKRLSTFHTLYELHISSLQVHYCTCAFFILISNTALWTKFNLIMKADEW